MRKLLNLWCRGPESNRHDSFGSQDFKSENAVSVTPDNYPETHYGRGFRTHFAPGCQGSKIAVSGASVIPVSSGRG